ncbi:MAG: DoxX family protein [Candidatus Kryptoniota bacterium]
MNIVLWVLQILLALWNIAGGGFIINNHEKAAGEWALSALPKLVWIFLGVLQILLALGLILPGSKLRKPTAIAAACLSALSLLGIALYAKYAGFPGILWGVVPATLAGFVAYKRWLNLPQPKIQRSASS